MQLPLTISLPAVVYRRLLILLASAHALALSCLWPLPFDALIKLALALLLLWSMLRQWRRCTAPERLCQLSLQRDGRLRVTTQAGASHVARVLPDTNVHPWLSVIWLQLPDGRRHVLTLLPGCLPADDGRRLRVWLRWCAGTAQEVGEDVGEAGA